MDPREIVNQIRNDLGSNRLAAVALAAILGLGMACWFPALAARISARRTPSRQPEISVLSDPFGGRNQ